MSFRVLKDITFYQKSYVMVGELPFFVSLLSFEIFYNQKLYVQNVQDYFRLKVRLL